MRIYTEVNFEWDDKQNKLVETSSKSFEYNGPMALCAEYRDYYYFDLQGNRFHVNVKGKRYDIGGFKAHYTTVKDQNGKTVYTYNKDHWGSKEHQDKAKNFIKGQATEGKYFRAESMTAPPDEWQQAYFDQYRFWPSLNAVTDLKWAEETQKEGFSWTRAYEIIGEGERISEEYWTWKPTPMYEDLEGNMLTEEEMSAKYGDLFSADDYVEGEEGIWTWKHDEPFDPDPNMYQYDGETRTEAWMIENVEGFDTGQWTQLKEGGVFTEVAEDPVEFTKEWVEWMHENRDKEGFDPEFDKASWQDDDGDGVWDKTELLGGEMPDELTKEWLDWMSNPDNEGKEGWSEDFNRENYIPDDDNPGFFKFFEDDFTAPDEGTEEWVQWMHDNRYEEGFDPDFDIDNWQDDDGDGVWEEKPPEQEAERMFKTSTGQIRSETWMELYEIGFDAEQWEELEAGEPWTKKGEDVPIGFAAQQAAHVIQTAIADWKAIVDPTVQDEFQKEIEDALLEIGWAEDDIITAFEELTYAGGGLETIGEDWEANMEQLLGSTWEDPLTGEVYTAQEAYDQKLITEEEFNVIEGTYSADIRAEEEARTEGLEETVVSREEKLESLREEAVGEVRAAEAKIGAAGFASTGAGQTAREMLAEEIGEGARDIEEGFVEERGDIGQGYIREIGEIKKGKQDAIDKYKKERDRAATEEQKPLKRLTEARQRLLTLHGAEEGEEGDYTLEGVTGGTEARAEAALSNIQLDLMGMIDLLRSPQFEDDVPEDWDPFADPETTLGQPAPSGRTWGEIFGWKPLSQTFDFDVTKGLFRPTIEEFKYEPSKAMKEFDPTYVLPWEEADYVPPWETEE